MALGLALATAIAVNPATAKDTKPCGVGMVCASAPKTVADVLQDEGYKAKIDVDNQGDPKITSSANGFNYDIYFYGCEKGKDCDSLQFNVSFKAEDDNTPEYANAWNVKKRFLQASTNDKKELELRYDVTTAGGLNKRNFADVVDWWSSMLGDFTVFVKEQQKK